MKQVRFFIISIILMLGMSSCGTWFTLEDSLYYVPISTLITRTVYSHPTEEYDQDNNQVYQIDSVDTDTTYYFEQYIQDFSIYNYRTSYSHLWYWNNPIWWGDFHWGWSSWIDPWSGWIDLWSPGWNSWIYPWHRDFHWGWSSWFEPWSPGWRWNPARPGWNDPWRHRWSPGWRPVVRTANHGRASGLPRASSMRGNSRFSPGSNQRGSTVDRNSKHVDMHNNMQPQNQGSGFRRGTSGIRTQGTVNGVNGVNGSQHQNRSTRIQNQGSGFRSSNSGIRSNVPSSTSRSFGTGSSRTSGSFSTGSRSMGGSPGGGRSGGGHFGGRR